MPHRPYLADWRLAAMRMAQVPASTGMEPVLRRMSLPASPMGHFTMRWAILPILLLFSIDASAQTPQAPQSELKAAQDFASIGDQAARSRALFTEAAKVLNSPRCINCHPAGDRPTQ